MTPGIVTERAYAEVWNEVEIAQRDKAADDSWLARVADWTGISGSPDLIPLPDTTGYSRAAVEDEKLRIYNRSEYDLYTKPMKQEDRKDHIDVIERARRISY